MSWEDEKEVLIGRLEDPKHFAGQCLRLYQDASIWQKIQQGSMESMQQYARHHSISRGVEGFSRMVRQHFNEAKMPSQAASKGQATVTR